MASYHNDAYYEGGEEVEHQHEPRQRQQQQQQQRNSSHSPRSNGVHRNSQSNGAVVDDPPPPYSVDSSTHSKNSLRKVSVFCKTDDGIIGENGHPPDAPPPNRARKYSISDKDIIPLKRKLALAIGAAPLSLPIVTVMVFITLFLLDVALLEPKYSSLVLLLGRSFDAISDPLIGFFVNMTQRKGNTLKYWMVSALPFIICAYFFIWFVPIKDGDSQGFLFAYYLGMYILLQIAFTVYSVPYAALIMYQSNNPRQRDIATAFRMTAEIVFAILAIGIMGGIVSDSLDSDDSCDEESGEKNAEWLEDTQHKYLIAGGIICATVILSGIITFFGTNERKDITIPASKISAKTATKQVMTFKPYLILMSSYFCVYLSTAIIQGNLQPYFKYNLDQVDHFTYGMMALMVCTALGIPVWQVVIGKVGKKITAYIGVVILIPCYAVIGLVPKDVPIFVIYTICCVAGFGIGSAYLIPWSMLPDVIDSYTVKNHERSESIFFGFFVFFNKFAAGAGNGISLAMLGIAGYDNDYCTQPDGVKIALRLLCSPGPAVLVGCYCFLIWLYPITEEVCATNKQILTQRLKQEKYDKRFEEVVNRAFKAETELIAYL